MYNHHLLVLTDLPKKMPVIVVQIEITHIRVERVDGQTHEWDVPETTMRDLLLGPWHGISTEDDQYKLLAGRDKNAANNLYMFDDGDVSPSGSLTRQQEL